ncbi:J domain-containing protein [Pseudomonas veronii]|nr:J domain-containing protein [Pseudomonas veronii]
MHHHDLLPDWNMRLHTHYSNLHILETADVVVIKASFRALAQKYHPDRNPKNTKEAERIFKVLNDAYTVLSDPISRAEYDALLKRKRGVGDSPPPAQPASNQRSEPEAMSKARWPTSFSAFSGNTQGYSDVIAGMNLPPILKWFVDPLWRIFATGQVLIWIYSYFFGKGLFY